MRGVQKWPGAESSRLEHSPRHTPQGSCQQFYPQEDTGGVKAKASLGQDSFYVREGDRPAPVKMGANKTVRDGLLGVLIFLSAGFYRANRRKPHALCEENTAGQLSS